MYMYMYSRLPLCLSCSRDNWPQEMSFSKSIKKGIDLWPAALISDQNVNRVQTESLNMTITCHWSQRGDGWVDKSPLTLFMLCLLLFMAGFPSVTP